MHGPITDAVNAVFMAIGWCTVVQLLPKYVQKGCDWWRRRSAPADMTATQAAPETVNPVELLCGQSSRRILLFGAGKQARCPRCRCETFTRYVGDKVVQVQRPENGKLRIDHVADLPGGCWILLCEECSRVLRAEDLYDDGPCVGVN